MSIWCTLLIKLRQFNIYMRMNYERIYKNMIEKRRQYPLDSEIYGEYHHIIPRSLGGSDDNDNIIRLTAREHFIKFKIQLRDQGGNTRL